MMLPENNAAIPPHKPSWEVQVAACHRAQHSDREGGNRAKAAGTHKTPVPMGTQRPMIEVSWVSWRARGAAGGHGQAGW